MKSSMYAVFDTATQAYLAPFTMRSDAEASRAFGVAVSDPKTQFHRHESDYTLYRIGTFDDGNGMLVSVQPPVLVARAIEFKREPSGELGGQHGDEFIPYDKEA